MANNCANCILLKKESGFSESDQDILRTSTSALKALASRLQREVEKTDLGVNGPRWVEWEAFEIFQENDEGEPVEIVIFADSAWVPCETLVEHLTEMVSADSASLNYDELGNGFMGGETFVKNEDGTVSSVKSWETDLEIEWLEYCDAIILKPSNDSEGIKELVADKVNDNCYVVGVHDELIIRFRATEELVNDDYKRDEDISVAEDEASLIDGVKNIVQGIVPGLLTSDEDKGKMARVLCDCLATYSKEYGFSYDLAKLREHIASLSPAPDMAG